jgi:HSP20 family protein
MEGKSLTPTRGEARDLAPQGRQDWLSPFSGFSGFGSLQTLRDEVNRLFDSVFRGFGETAQGAAWPSLEVRDNEGEYKVTAELPGVDEKDVELSVQDGVLTIRGEKKSETEDKERHFSERTYGRFERRIALGDIDEDKIKASFENGVLTVTAPKSPQAQAKIKRIPISGKTVH